MKPKIADLERLETKRSDRGWMATLDEHRFLWTCLPDLLRLARAAKNACGQVIARSDHEYRTRLELQQSLDAFDWGDE